MALKFLNKKGWHTGSLRNIENVWKAEQKHEAEERKLEELKKQIQDEREAQEFRLLQEQAGLIPKQERLEFLYDSGLAVGKVSTDEYLLGKPVEPEKTQTEVEKSAAAPGALFVDEKPQSANDQWRKLHSDPLLLIRQQEQAALARIKNNPVKMEMIKKSIVEKISKKEKKQRHKEKKHKEKQRKRKHSSDSEESIDNQNLDNKVKDKADGVNDEKVKARKERREAEHSSHISRRESPRKMKESPKKRHDSPDSVVERRRDTYRAEHSPHISRHKSPRKKHGSPDSSGERRQDTYRAEHRLHVSRHESPRRRQDSPRKRHDSPDSVGERRRHTYRADRSPHISRYENSRRRQDSPRKKHYGADSVGERRGDTSKAEHSPYVSRHENPSKGQDSPRKRHDSPDSVGEGRRDAYRIQESFRKGRHSPDSVVESRRDPHKRQGSPKERHDSPDSFGERRQDTCRRNSSPDRDRSANGRRSSKEWELSKQHTVDRDEDRSNHVNNSSPRRGSRRHDSRSPDGFGSHGMQRSFKKHDVAKVNDIQYRRHCKSRSPRRSSRSPKRRDDYSHRQGYSPKREPRRWDSKSPPRVRHDRRYDSPDSSDVGRQWMKSREKKEISIDKKVEVAIKNEEKCIGLDNLEGNKSRYKHKVGKLSEEEKAERLRAMQIDAEVHEEQRWHRLKKASDADKLEEDRGTVNGNNFLDVTARNIYGAAAEGNIASVEESVRRRTHFIKRSIGDSNENTFQRS